MCILEAGSLNPAIADLNCSKLTCPESSTSATCRTAGGGASPPLRGERCNKGLERLVEFCGLDADVSHELTSLRVVEDLSHRCKLPFLQDSVAVRAVHGTSGGEMPRSKTASRGAQDTRKESKGTHSYVWKSPTMSSFTSSICCLFLAFRSRSRRRFSCVVRCG